MAYEGYKIKFGNNVFPEAWIKAGSYTAAPNQRMDLDSYRDANGVLHRTVLGHTATKIEWAVPHLPRQAKSNLMSFLLSNMTDIPSRTFTVTYYDDESDGYKTGTFYMPDIAFTEYGMEHYEPIRLALIEY